MCGIAGAFSIKPLDQARIAQCQSLMLARGPDGHSVTEIDLARQGVVTFLHSRLSIVDLDSRSDQPFEKDGDYIVFNGEIYNFPEIREELEALGHHFRTTSDTEVILSAYRQWGTDCVLRFEGMWAFVIFDSQNSQIFLSRDRFGEKPLYVWELEGVVYFGSEVRHLMALAGRKADVNFQHLRRFLVNGYKALYPSGEDFFKGIRAFSAGSNAVLTEPGPISERRFWQLRFNERKMTRQEAQEGAFEKVKRAIELRLRADVPIALRLSGGVDSNVALAMAQKELGRDVHTFSIVEDDPRYDETASILKAIEYHQCPHDIIQIPKQDFIERLYGLIDYFGKPVMTISYYLHALVSERIHQQGYKVSLGGTGADELFSGYYDHYLFWLAEMHGHQKFDQFVNEWRNSYGKFVRNPFLQDPRAFIDNPKSRDHIFLGADKFSSFLIEPFVEPHSEKSYGAPILRDRMLNEVLDETVPVMLHDDDLSAMAHSVENRAVYLDSQLAEFLFTVPSEYLFGNGLPKYLLRSCGKNIAPREIMENPRKQGINAPVTSFVDFSDKKVQQVLLDDSQVYDILDRAKVEALLNSPVTLNSESKFLFSVISAKMFLDSHNSFEIKG